MARVWRYDNDGKTTYWSSITDHRFLITTTARYYDASAKLGCRLRFTDDAAHLWITDHDGIWIYSLAFADMSKCLAKDAAVFPDDFAGDTNVLLRTSTVTTLRT